jgi:farnesyl-diphosphate farnesyltransferase
MPASPDLLGDVLGRVSRSFFLSLRILPRDLREPIGLAYLLARASDTVADTRLIARAERLRHLERLERAFAGEPVDVGPVADACAPLQAYAAERMLLERLPEILDRTARLPRDDADHVRRVLATIVAGQTLDLTRFPGTDAADLAALETLEELDHYTYLVAGCVGEFWTRLHRSHRPRLARWDVERAVPRAIAFGKALQLTNVIRDVPADLRQGRCYLPAHELAGFGLVPGDLLTAGGARRARPLVHRLIGIAREHYRAGWRYTLDLPRAEVRMRLACAWPLLIGVRTLAMVAAHPDPLGDPAPIKLPRTAVRGILARSTLTIWSNRVLERDAVRAMTRIAV